MKNLKRRISAVLLSAVMVAGMAAPASANAEGDYFFRSYGGSGAYLNSWGSTVSKGTKIRLYSYTGDNTQKWRVYKASDGTYSLRSCANTALAINRDSNNNNAILWTWVDGRDDSDMYVHKFESTGIYEFVLIKSGKYLTALGSTSGSYVNFQSYNDPNSTWKK